MALPFNKFDNFSLALATGKYNFSTDSLSIALCATASTPVRTNAKTADITQIAYTNLSSRALTLGSATDVAGLYTVKFNNLTLTASGAVAAFQYIVILDTTAVNNELIGWFDYGSAVPLNNSGDNFTIAFDQTNGVFTIQ